MDNTFDLVVVGTGAAASTVANRCRAAGWSVAIVDELPYGGTCQLRGCDPKKVLRRAAEVVDATRLMRRKGVRDPGLTIDWPALMAFKRSFTDPVPANRERAFAEAGIDAFKGTARFIDETTLVVGDDRLCTRHVVIASGAKPVPLPMEGAEHVVTSDRFLELDHLPERLLFIGGGYISFEFAHVAARADAKVIVLDRGERPLKAFDPELVAKLLERTRTLGVTFHPNAAVEAIERTTAGFRVQASVAGRAETFEADLVVHGAGRVPDLDALDLERANVRFDNRGVEVNEFLQSTSNAAVYAAGDAAASPGWPAMPRPVFSTPTAPRSTASMPAATRWSRIMAGRYPGPGITLGPGMTFGFIAAQHAHRSLRRTMDEVGGS